MYSTKLKAFHLCTLFIEFKTVHNKMASKLGLWTLDEKLRMIEDCEKSGFLKTAFSKTKDIC